VAPRELYLKNTQFFQMSPREEGRLRGTRRREMDFWSNGGDKTRKGESVSGERTMRTKD
jgi:hypothetical protein